jgi:hypothetical protein
VTRLSVRQHRRLAVLAASAVEEPAPLPPPTWWEQVTGRQVLVHKKDDMTVRGIVSEVLADGVVLRFATALPDEGPEVKLAGDTWIPLENVNFAQLVPRDELEE